MKSKDDNDTVYDVTTYSMNLSQLLKTQSYLLASLVLMIEPQKRIILHRQRSLLQLGLIFQREILAHIWWPMGCKQIN